MDIAKAIIAGIATILSALLTLLIKEYLDNRRYKKVENEIKDAIYGKWIGQIQQTLNGNIELLKVELNLKVTHTGAITGKAKLPYNNEVYHLDLDGGFYSSRFIKMSYENSSKAILQFGTFIFRLSDTATKLTGHFVGYGQISGTIIAGSASFEKV